MRLQTPRSVVAWLLTEPWPPDQARQESKCFAARPAERQARQRDSEIPPHIRRTARTGSGRDPECGVCSRRRDPKRSRNVVAPLGPGTAPSLGAKTGSPHFPNTLPRGRPRVLRICRPASCPETPRAARVLIAKHRPPKGGRRGSPVATQPKTKNHFLPGDAPGRAASSKIDRAQSVCPTPALRAAWRIARFSPGRNRTVMNSPR